MTHLELSTRPQRFQGKAFRFLLALPAVTPAAVSGALLLLQPAAAIAQETGADGAAGGIFSGGVLPVLVGGLMMLLLLALSITAGYLVIDQIVALRRRELIPEQLGDKVRQLIKGGRPDEAEQACRAAPSVLAFVLISGLSEIEAGWDAIEKALEDSLAEQSARLFRKVEYLSVIGNIAPMVGLLGTVIGMTFVFAEVAATQGTAGATELASGIATALYTTVGGLIVAIPSLGAFAILRNRVDRLIAETAYAAQHAFTPLKPRMAKKWKSADQPVAPPPQPVAPPPVDGS